VSPRRRDLPIRPALFVADGPRRTEKEPLYLKRCRSVLTGPLAIGAGVISGTLFGLAAATFFHAVKADDRNPPNAPPEREPIEPAAAPQQVIFLEAEAPQSVRFWLERVERSAEAEGANASF
jgi:hypothetical protein